MCNCHSACVLGHWPTCCGCGIGISGVDMSIFPVEPGPVSGAYHNGYSCWGWYIAAALTLGWQGGSSGLVPGSKFKYQPRDCVSKSQLWPLGTVTGQQKHSPSRGQLKPHVRTSGAWLRAVAALQGKDTSESWLLTRAGSQNSNSMNWH